MNGYWKQKFKNSDYLNPEKHPFFVWIGSAFLMEFLLEVFSRKSILDAAVFLLDSPFLFLLNVLIIMAPYSLIFLTRRSVFVHSVVSVIFFALGLADFVLLLFRTTPFTAKDFSQIDSALRVMEHYVSWLAVAGAVLLVLILLAALVVLWIKAPVFQGKMHRVRFFLLSAANFGAVAVIYSSAVSGLLVPERFSNVAQAYQDYGLVYCFMSSLVNTGISRPDDYTEEQVEEIMDHDMVPEQEEEIADSDSSDSRETGDEAALLGKQDGAANVIFLQLESFYDVTHLKDLECSKDPIPFIHELEENYSTGFLSVPCVGAGTANTEFEIMTGMNLDFFGPGEYPYQTVLKNMTCESLATVFRGLGYTAQAIHNNSAYFYNRYSVFSQLGYDIFTSIEYMNGVEYTENGWAKDSILTGCILDALDATSGRDYIYTISVQGHGSYPEEEVLSNPAVAVTLSPEDGEEDSARANQFTYYVNQIHEMDEFVRNLVSALSDYGEPCVLVLYGDHLPALGITEEEMTCGDLFQTNYVIWNNFGLEREVRDVEAYQLGALVTADIDISEGILFRYHQKYLQDDSEDETEYLDNMAMIDYDMLYGEQTVYENGEPPQATKIKMGTHTIRIRGVQYEEETGTLKVHGTNFNAFSIVVVNGKQYTPEDWSEDELTVTGVPAKGLSQISVAQMDDYSKMILSSTFYYYAQLGEG